MGWGGGGGGGCWLWVYGLWVVVLWVVGVVASGRIRRKRLLPLPVVSFRFWDLQNLANERMTFVNHRWWFSLREPRGFIPTFPIAPSRKVVSCGGKPHLR